VGWFRIAECGAQAATALADGIRDARFEDDLDYIALLHARATEVRDPGVLSAALEVAADPSASIPARVMSLRVVYRHKNATVDFRGSWQALVSTPRGISCTLEPMIHHRLLYESPLPAEYGEQIATVTEGIWFDPNEPVVIRDLARCVRVGVRDLVPETVDPELIELSYVCGNRFAVKNLHPKFWAKVTYRVLGTTEAATFSVRPGGQIRVFNTLDTGTVDLSYLGQVIQTVENAGVACP
jgi:hypothetical protein